MPKGQGTPQRSKEPTKATRNKAGKGTTDSKELSEQIIRVDGEIKRRKNGYYEKVSERYRIFAFAVVLSLALLAGALMIIYGEYITYDNFVYLIRDLDSVKGSSDGFTTVNYTSDDTAIYKPFRDGFAVIGSTDVTLYDETGVILCSEKENPYGSSSDKYVLAYDIGGVSYSIYSSVTRVVKKTVDNPIISASVSNDGAYIVTTESSDAKYVTEVYNSDFKRTMSIYKDKYVIDSVIGKDSGTFVIVSVAEKGAEFFAEVSFYKDGNDKPLAAYTYSMAMPVSAASYNGGTFSVLFDDCIRFYSGDGTLKSEKYVKDAKITYFDTRSTGAVLLSSRLGIKGGNDFMSFDKDGKVVCTASIDSKVSGVYAPWKESSYSGYFVSADGGVTAVLPDGDLKDLTDDKTVKAVIDTSSGTVAMTPTKAYLVISEE